MTDHASYTKSAAFYDAIYAARGKDYAREAAHVHAVIQRHKRSPGRTLLDVACGTGGHLAALRQHYDVAGLDLDPAMLAIARRKHPDLPLQQGDMVDLNLGRQFDAVVCLFSAIAYALTVPRLHQTLQTMSRHLWPGGVVIAEPFIRPEDVRQGFLSADFVDEPGLKIARMNISTVQDRVVSLNFHFLVGTPQGTQYFTERHDLAAFRHQDYLEAFHAAGLDVVYDSEGLTGRGLYIGLKPQVTSR
jgi:ubiquinone/menaquinone biosynthesis C-methylase UbiE